MHGAALVRYAPSLHAHTVCGRPAISLAAASLLLFATVTGAALGCTHYCTRRLGGVTGDAMGAVREFNATAALCFLALFIGGNSY
ncbi:MAG: adenosylcobinamide-GDP ribazoletransferase [Deltaproteobacteria bacterium]|nr:adenosylcobinamide-GDP ribazoletransferase [Deltaproteobacteria bacterium]